ncbi:MAG: adenine deaminase [Chitinophagaceae bacterium]|nr:adenine deaminase [Chitinophagaceae bacterium]
MAVTLKGNLVDIAAKKIFYAEVKLENGRIHSINEITAPLHGSADAGYILPGFIDSHVHIESSLLVPSEFARLAVVHGTVGTVSDPHEIANVCGLAGVEYMIENGNTVPFKFNFGAPSCVPATVFETAGAALYSNDVRKLLERKEIRYLSEMMNFPGVLFKDEEVMKKIQAAHELGKPVDGHAPGLRGEKAKQYIDAGISTDHECFTKEEALEKLQYGMKILIREGSAARNFEALADLLHDHADQMMFCSDDKHPDSLLLGHINQLCARAVAKGIDLFKVLRAACINPVEHYKLAIGQLRPGDPADLIIVEDLKNFKVRQTYIDAELVAENGISLIKTTKASLINQFNCSLKKEEELSVETSSASLEIPVIEALEGQLITNRLSHLAIAHQGKIESSVKDDILKMLVINRYNPAPIAKAFIRNFGLKEGALASSVAHDSHNIVAVGVDDASLCKAVNLVIAAGGGLSAVMPNYEGDSDELVLPLPVAGLMSNADGYAIAEKYTRLDQFVKERGGSTLAAPFMTLSFMALLVIPHLKLSDKGLFDGDSFQFLEAWH